MVFNNSIKSAEARSQVIKTGRRDKFFVHTNKLAWLQITEVELEVNNLVTLNAEVVGHQVGQGCEMLLIDAELVVSDGFNTTLEEVLND